MPRMPLPPNPEVVDPDLVNQIEEFVRVNGLSDEMKEELLGSPDGTIECIMKEGAFPKDCSNASTVVGERLEKIREFFPWMPRVMCFVRDNNIDGAATDQLLDMPEQVRERVIVQGPVEGRNPSAVTISPIRTARNRLGM